jgi:hypothetical protein
MQKAAANAVAQAELAEERRTVAASLPPEPPVGCTDAILSGMFQMPDGARHVRRFRLSAPVAEMFDFVESVGAGGMGKGAYRLVTRFPRRVLERGAGSSVAEALLSPGREVFVLESIAK